eukprot:TRINITY_DN1218_c0_g1_i2.p2 TRINITY_DN1218_c0_g1~~TRINITY_DN1218_c0_g1_i2.p2  ORF type:complete len:401 (+),score=80.10 TRINITY_DN1218_c0_g1_i2:692-1894(+)
MLREREEAGAEQDEINQIQEQFSEEKKSDPLWLDQEEPEYPSVKMDYVVCLDTLGQDREISEEDQHYFESIVHTMGEKWEECERQLLHRDVELQVQYLESISSNFEVILDNFLNEEENFIIEKQEMLNEFKDREFELMYETECIRLERVRMQLQDPEIARYLYMLKDYHIVKYSQVFQIALYLIGYKKQDINIQGTNILDWNSFRKNILDDEREELQEEEKFINLVLSYEHRGAKETPVPDYAKIMRLTKRKEKLQQAEIDAYNIGLGRLFHYLDLILKLRRMDIELRTILKQKQRQERQDKIQENEQIAVLKEQELDNLRSGLTEEELEGYDMEEWERNFEEQNPLQEIPSEIFDDVDVDLEVAQDQEAEQQQQQQQCCLLYTSPSPRDRQKSRMPSSA